MSFYNNSNKNNATTHGLSGTSLYKIWKRMLYKVAHNKIEIEPRWLDLHDFIDDMDLDVQKANHVVMTRIDLNGPYNKNNCKFKIG